VRRSFFLSKKKIGDFYCRDFDDDDLVEGVAAVTLQEVETRLIQLDPTIQDTMWYV
jgi:hypothetical protein